MEIASSEDALTFWFTPVPSLILAPIRRRFLVTRQVVYWEQLNQWRATQSLLYLIIVLDRKIAVIEREFRLTG